MTRGGADVIIIEIKCTINVMHLNHPQTTPHFQSVEKLPSTKLVYKDAHSPRERRKLWSWGVWWGRKEGGLLPSLLTLCLLPSLAIDINSSDIKALYRRCQAPGQAGPGLQGCAALCHSGATEPELPGDTEEAQYQHPGEGELDLEGGPSHKAWPPLPVPSRDQLGQRDTRAGLPPLPWTEWSRGTEQLGWCPYL